VHATFVRLWYVGVIRFVFHVLQLLPIRFTEPKLVLHWQIYNEVPTKIGPKIGLDPPCLWSS
jgi:hypothetical protein